MEAVVAAFIKEKALVWAFSGIVKGSFPALLTGDPDNPDYEYECKETAECANLEKCSKGDAANGTASQCGCKELTCERECDTAEG